MIDLSANNYTQILTKSNVIEGGTNRLTFDPVKIREFSAWLVDWFGLDPDRWTVELYNSGTEAIEVAVRKAIAVSGKDLFHFKGSYHGHSMYVNTFSRELIYSDQPLPRADILLLELNPWVHGLKPRPEDRWMNLNASELKQATGNAILIADEISSGIYKTGEVLSKKYNFDSKDADIVVVGKGIGGAFPVIAVLGKKEIMNSTTYTYNTFGYSSKAVDSIHNTLNALTNLGKRIDIEHYVKEEISATITNHLRNSQFDTYNKGCMLAIHLKNHRNLVEFKKLLLEKNYSINVYPQDTIARLQFPVDSDLAEVKNALHAVENSLHNLNSQ